ncbi:MAG: hypothetical protein MGF17_18030 [Trichodesmium sp. MAG_R04]|nr:hypothetical protein [Trichodesmium sp. MAG_R04]
MHNYNYTQIIISFLLLLGNTASSQVLMIANELELSTKFFRGSTHNNHGNVESPPPGRENIRNYSQLINVMPGSGLDNQDITIDPFRRGSGR